MGQPCTDVTKTVLEKVNAFKLAYKLNVDDALSNLIGVPSKKGKRNKIIYNMHKLLYDSMHEYIMESGRLSEYGVDPFDAVKHWGNYWARRHNLPINSSFFDDSLKGQGRITKRRLIGMYNQFERVRKKRNTILARKNQRMRNWERALYPPELMMMNTDRFGKVGNLIDETEALRDHVIQAYFEHHEKIKVMKKDFKMNFENLLKNGQIDLNNPLDGLPGFYDSDGLPLRIIKRNEHESGRVTYVVKYENEDITKTLSPKQFGYQRPSGLFSKVGTKLGMGAQYPKFTQKMYEGALLNKYMNRFVNDLIHGQTRYFIPKAISEMTQRDRLIIKHEIHRRKIRKDKRVAGEWVGKGTPEIQLSDDEQSEYIMIKQETDVADGNFEKHHVYLMRVKESGKWKNAAFKVDEAKEEDYNVRIFDFIEEGFYKANSEKAYQQMQLKGKTELNESSGQYFIVNEDNADKIVDRSFKAFNSFTYMGNQPEGAILNKRTISQGKSNFETIFSLVEGYRSVYENVFNDMQTMAYQNNKDTIREINVMKIELRRKINPETNKKYTESESMEWINDNIHKIGGISNSVWSSEKWGMSTPDAYFQKISEYYGPVMFTTKIFEEMLDDALDGLDVKLKKKLSAKSKAVYTKAKANLEMIRDMSANKNGGEWTREIKEAARTVHTEHREEWTDNTKRRKDDSVHLEYLEKTYSNLLKNKLTNSMVQTMYHASKFEKYLPSDIMGYLVNKVKLTLGHTDTINRVPGFKGWSEFDNGNAADWLNTWLPKSLKAGREFDEDTAERMFLTINGLTTMRFLGTSGAMGNRTQILNPIIHFGFQKYWEMQGKFKEDAVYWDKVVDATGVLNMLSMFNDHMLSGGDVEGISHFDFGLYPFSNTVMKNLVGAGIPIPSQNMVHWFKLVTKGKDNFVKNGHSNIDNVLLKMIHTEKSTIRKEEISYLRELGQKLASLDSYEQWDKEWQETKDSLSPELRDELEKKRDSYWDLMNTEERDNTKEIIEKRMRRLVGNVADHKFRKMVTWKLSYHFLPSKHLFTFTEGEQQMRKETAIMALLVADSIGLLGIDKSDQDRFFTPGAKKIARDAVYQQMFGMSPVWLGEAFSGAGRTVMQYKAYTLFQMIHDSNVSKNFLDSAMGSTMMSRGTDNVTRLFKAFEDGSEDYEAQSVIRMIGTRGVASMFGVMASIAPIMFKMVGRASGVSKVIRSAENPAFALIARLAVWLVIMGMGGSGDDEEKQREDWGNRLMFMLLPVLLGTILRDGYELLTD